MRINETHRVLKLLLPWRPVMAADRYSCGTDALVPDGLMEAQVQLTEVNLPL